MKKYFRDYAFLISIAGFIVLLDQVTKYLVRANLAYSEMYAPISWLADYARLVNWRNTGAAFGIFENLSLVFTVLAFIVAAAIIFYFPQVPREDWILRLAMSLQLGGAVGNLIDRLARGYVTDFISVGNFAVFNVADASISIGTAILIYGIWDKERQEKKAAREASEDEFEDGSQGESSISHEMDFKSHETISTPGVPSTPLPEEIKSE